jgi:hypothetical protein
MRVKPFIRLRKPLQAFIMVGNSYEVNENTTPRDVVAGIKLFVVRVDFVNVLRKNDKAAQTLSAYALRT